MSSSLDFLRSTGTVISCDTPEYEEIAQFSPTDATTNPSLVLAAVKKEPYSRLLDRSVEYAAGTRRTLNEQVSLAMDRLLVEFGARILSIIPGLVSLSVDPRLAYDETAIVEKAQSLLSISEEVGLSKDRILIKIPATWQGIQAARFLEQRGIHTNMTLLFGMVQAAACGEAGATLVSPFVGRIKDWHEKAGRKVERLEDHPGVVTTKAIRDHYVLHNYKTRVMACGFRNVDEIRALGGLDLLTIPPSLLSPLKASTSFVANAFTAHVPIESQRTSYISNFALYQDDLSREGIALDKLPDGLKKFSADADELERLIQSHIDLILSRKDRSLCATEGKEVIVSA